MNYFIIVNDTQQGPYTIEELRQRHIDASTLVWAEGMAQWTPAWQVEELKTLFNATTGNGANATSTPPPMPGTQDGAGDAQSGLGTPQDPSANGQAPHADKKTMKVWTWIGAAAVALLIIMAVANPSRDEHRRAIKENVTNGIEKGLTSSTPDNEDPFKIFGTAMLKAFATPMVNAAIDNMLQYHNYLFWSTTTIDLPDSDSEAGSGSKSVRTSLGIFGKVFTTDEDDIAKAISKIVNGDSAVSDQSSVVNDNNDDATSTDNDADNDIASQVSDSVVSIGSKVGKNVAKKVSHEVGQEIKKEIRQNTDSTTASGIGKIVDAVENFLKSL